MTSIVAAAVDRSMLTKRRGRKSIDLEAAKPTEFMSLLCLDVDSVASRNCDDRNKRHVSSSSLKKRESKESLDASTSMTV
jgi:hypothetical protein